MNLRPEHLPRHLREGRLAPLYWVAGDETLLCQEAMDGIRQAAREQQFEEREVYFPDRDPDWQRIIDSGNSLSLFSSRKLIELRLPSFRLEDKGRQRLAEYLQSPNPDTLLLISTPKPEASALKTRWFKAIEQAGVFVQVWPVDLRQLPGWIEQRLQQRGMSATPDAIRLLCDRVEGNLLAAHREIEKLALLTAGQEREMPLDARFIANTVADNARYNVFQMVDHALMGDARKALRSLNSLRGEGSEPLMLLGLITRELRSLLQLRRHVESGLTEEQAMQKERVWKSRQRAVRQALSHLDSGRIEELLLLAREVDLAVKGMALEPGNLLLDRLVLALAGQIPIRPNALMSSLTSRSATG
ncbi:MAG: DNA polymerase III subunit delta [Pseudomonadota bacterium]